MRKLLLALLMCCWLMPARAEWKLIDFNDGEA
ncbi:MAG: hypothetical protein RL083_1400, partial [Pseudomonadota bacterium]